MKTKYCPKCKKEKSLSDFYKHSGRKDGLRVYCKRCNNENVKEYYENHLWKRVLYDIKKRCNNSNCEDYKNYGARGIKCLITETELKELWFRDKAYNMNKPSIDRKNNDGNYEYDNCQFIELRENCCKDKRKIVLQFDLEGNFIKEWKSNNEAGRKTAIAQTSISACCLGERKSAGGFIWKYKSDVIILGDN